MRLSQTPPSLLSLLLVALSNIESAQSWPLLGTVDFSFLAGRTCASYCGADNQFCCTSGQSCTTDAANVASCVAAVATVAGGAFATVAGGGSGGYAVYTTTYTETDLVLRTSTYSSYWTSPAAATYYSAAAPVPSCTTSLGETSCGSICCASNQNCFTSGSCTARPSTQGYGYGGTSTYSPAVRPTGGAVSTATSIVSATTTQPFIAPATASGSTLPIASTGSKGLSAGAIAGIVIGTIAGVLLLLLICFCCIVKAGFDGLLAIFGLGGSKRRRSTERVEVIEERYSRHGSGTASRRQTHSGWFGGGGRPTRVEETRKKSSGFGGLGTIGAALIGLAVILGLKRKSGNRNEKPARSEISSSYYSYEDSYTGSSPSSASSDRRTRNSRGSRGTRATRPSRR